MNPLALLSLIPSWGKLALMAAAVSAGLGFYAWRVHAEREYGRAEIQLAWDAATSRQLAAALAESESNARETKRRLERQQENQNAYEKLLAELRRDAALNDADASRLRSQQGAAAQRWNTALGNTPTVGQCASAGAALILSADVLARADQRASLLAAHADASRAAGIKCSSDYDSLTARQPVSP